MLPPGNQPCNGKASPLWANAVPSPPLTRPQGPKCKKCVQSSALPVDRTRTSLEEQGPPPRRRPPALHASPPGPRGAQPPSGHLPTLTLRALPRDPPGPHLPPAQAQMQEPPLERMGQGRAGSCQVPVPPLAQTPPVHGPRQVLRRSPPPDEICEELPPRASRLGQRRPRHLPYVPECPQVIRARHPPLFSKGARQDPPPSGGPRCWPRRPRLVLSCPPGCPSPLH